MGSRPRWNVFHLTSVCKSFLSGRAIVMAHDDELSDVSRYLVDVQDEFSPSRFRTYMTAVKKHMPQSAYAELEAALGELNAVRQRVQRAVKEVESHRTN